MKNIFLVLLLTSVAITPTAYAANHDDAFVVQEITPISFGTLQLPTQGTNIVALSATGGGLSGDVTLTDTSRRGQYFIQGLKSNGNRQAITLDIQNIDTGNSSLKLEKFTGLYNAQSITRFPQNNLNAPTLSGVTLYLGATLKYNASLADKTYKMSFDLVVSYD